MNNVFAVGIQAATLTAKSNTPQSPLPSTPPPSPTAVAISLLNLLKIANSMSHPFDNPFLSGKQSSTQGQYELFGGETEREPRGTSLLPTPRTFAGPLPLPGAFAGFLPQRGRLPVFLPPPGRLPGFLLPPGRFPGFQPSPGRFPGVPMRPLGLPGNYRLDCGRMTVDEDIERCLDLNIGRAREEVRLKSAKQNAPVISNQRGQSPSSSTGMSSLTSSVSQGLKPYSVDIDSKSLNWLSVCKGAAEDKSSKMHSSASTSCIGSGGGMFNTASETKCDVQSIPGLADYNEPMPARCMSPNESNRPTYTSESASNILLQFGLEKEDLEQLICYPENQVTPENLPFILRQIRMNKDKRTSTVDKPKPYSEPQPITTVSEIKEITPTSSIGTALNQDEIPSLVLKPSKVIDYGHTGKYTAIPDGEHGRAASSTAKVDGGRSMLDTDNSKNSSRSRKVLTKITAGISGSFVSSHDQMSSVTTFSSVRSSMAPSSSGPAKKMEAQPSQTSQSAFASFSVPNKDTNLRHLGAGVPKSLPLKQPEPDRQSSAKHQPSSNLSHGVHPNRPGLILIGSNEQSQNSNRNKIEVQISKVSERVKKPAQQGQQPFQPRDTSTLKPIPAPAQLITSCATSVPGPPSKKQLAAKMGNPKHVPGATMIQDYAAATPEKFPHTCCLCSKDCTTLKDWVVHQNTPLHLENCKLLRSRYPKWHGETSTLLRSRSRSTSPRHDDFTTSHHRSRSRSFERLSSTRRRDNKRSPLRSREHQASSRRSGDRRSRSISPWHDNLTTSHHRSLSSSRNFERLSSPRRRDNKQSPLRSREHQASSRRSGDRRSRSISPWHDNLTTSHHRSLSSSRSFERLSSPRRRDNKRSPLRSREHQTSSRRSDDRLSRSISPWHDNLNTSHHRSRSRSFERCSSPRRRDNKRSPLRRSREHRASSRRSDDRLSPQSRRNARRSSADRALSQCRRSTSAERLAKKLLETPAVQSLSKQSDLKTMVKTLAPALLAELSKLTSSSQKSGTSSSTNPTTVVESPAAKVRIRANHGTLSQRHVTSALKEYGKVTSVVLFRSGKEAFITFEKEKDAKKFRTLESFEINGLPVSIFKERSIVANTTQPAKEQKASTKKDHKAAPPRKSAKPNTSKTAASKPSSTAKVKPPASSGAASKPSSTAKVKPPVSSGAETTTNKVSKTKVLASKAKSATKQVAKTVKTEMGKKKISVAPSDKNPKKDTKPSKQKETPKEPKNGAGKSAVATKETAMAKEKSKHIKKDRIDTDGKDSASKVGKDQLKESIKVEVKTGDAEPGATDPMEAESSVESKDQNVTDKAAKNSQTTIKAEETLTIMTSQDFPTASTHSESAVEEIRMETDPLKETEQKAKPKEMKQEVQAPEERACHKPAPEQVSNNSAGSPEAASSKPKPADEAESHQQASTAGLCDGTASEVEEKMENHQQPEETGFVQMQTETTSTDGTSVPPVSSAGSTASVTDAVASETASAEIPHITEDIFKAFTFVLRQHKQKKESRMHQEEKEITTISKTPFENAKEENTQNVQEDINDVDTSSEVIDENNFNFDDLVTVDEIGEDPKDTAYDSCSSSKPTSPKKIERLSSKVTSPAKKTMPESSKSCKSSTSASSSPTTTSSSSSKSVKTCVSPGKKAQQSKTSAAGGSNTSPRGQSTHSSATVVETSVETCQLHKKEDKPTEGAVVEFDHRVSAKGSAAKTVESESKMETSELDTPEQEERLEPTHESQKPKMESKAEIPEEVKMSKENEMHIEEDSKSTEDSENFKIIDSLEEPTDDQIITKDKDGITETRELNLKEDQISHQECRQVSDGADNDKVSQEACSEMETDPSIQEEDTFNNQAATPDNDEVSMVTEVKTKVAHHSDKVLVEAEAHKMLDSDTNQTLSAGAGHTGKQKEEIFSEELWHTYMNSEQMCEDNPHLGSSDDKDTQSKVSDNSAGDQTTTKGKGQIVEGPSAETSPIEEDNVVYQVIDSVEDQLTTETEPETDKEKQTKKGSETSSRDDRPTRSSRSKTSKSDDKDKTQKQITPGRKYGTKVKGNVTEKEEKVDEGTEEMEFEILDSIEDESVQEAPTTKGSGRRQSSRRHKEADKSEEMVFKILDSVGEENDSEKPIGTRSTRGRKGKTTEKSSETEESKKEKTPTRRRLTRARDSRERDRGTSPKTNVPQKRNTPTNKSNSVRDESKEEMTFEIIDAVEEEAEHKPPTTKSRRGRPKKDVKPSKEQTAASEKVHLPSEFAEDTEATTFQILDSIEDETIDEQATTDQTKKTFLGKSTSSKNDDRTTKKRTRSSKRKEEDEPVYQIVDSLEDYPSQEEQVTETSIVQKEKRGAKDKRAANVDSVPPLVVETSKAAPVKHESLLQEVGQCPTGSTPDKDLEKQEESDSAKSQKTSQKSPKKKDETSSANAVVSLDEVSDEEDDYPDDTIEKEKIIKIQAAFKEREDEQKEKKTGEKGTKERSRRGSGGAAKTKELRQEKVEAESQELVTLDEVGVGEADGVETTNSLKCGGGLTEGELQDLVTLDEIDEEEEQETPVIQPPSHEVQSGESSKPETLDEAGLGENKEADEEDSSSSVKRKHDDYTEDSEDFVTVDEVGTTEEEEMKTTTSAKCRPRKRSRRTPVRKSTRAKLDEKEVEEEEEEEEENEKLPPPAVNPPSTLDKDLSAPSGELETEKTGMETESVSTESTQPSESPCDPKLEAGVEEKGKEEIKTEVKGTTDDQLQKLTEPEAKRPRSESPCLPVDFKLPPFNPKNPQGQEFVVPKSGFFCSLCSMFYLKESTAKVTHCSSQKHYSNLLKHYQMFQQKTSPQSSQGPVSN
nr:zinc finger protein 638 isoform X1 [Nothobranchius furzeri]